jgi:hypothetical protein
VGPFPNVVDVAQVAGHVAAEVGAAAVVGMNVTVVRPRQTLGGFESCRGTASASVNTVFQQRRVIRV